MTKSDTISTPQSHPPPDHPSSPSSSPQAPRYRHRTCACSCALQTPQTQIHPRTPHQSNPAPPTQRLAQIVLPSILHMMQERYLLFSLLHFLHLFLLLALILRLGPILLLHSLRLPGTLLILQIMQIQSYHILIFPAQIFRNINIVALQQPHRPHQHLTHLRILLPHHTQRRFQLHQ
jgi:hypothetical protein